MQPVSDWIAHFLVQPNKMSIVGHKCAHQIAYNGVQCAGGFAFVAIGCPISIA